MIRDRNGRAGWVSVVRGNADGDLIRVFGNIHGGDLVGAPRHGWIQRRVGDAAGTEVDGLGL